MVNYSTGGTTLISGLGLKAATLADYALGYVSYALSAGLFVAVLAPMSAGQTMTKLGCVLNTAGATASGNNEMGIYSAAGVQLALTGDMSATLAGTAPAFVTGTLSTPYTVPTSGLYYLTMLTHFSLTAPKILGSPGAAGGDHAFTPINSKYASVFNAAVAASPASFDPTAASVNSAAYFLTAG